MGIYTNTGRNLRGEDLITKRDWFVVLGRCRFMNVNFPWANEVSPPDEELQPTIYNGQAWPDIDMDAPAQLAVGIRKAAVVSLVTPNPSGVITFDGQQWSVTTDSQAKHVYWKFYIEPEDFVGDAQGDNIVGYRRLSLRANCVPKSDSNKDPNTQSLRGFDLSDLGTLFFYSNQTIVNRAPNERHVIEIILPQ